MGQLELPLGLVCECGRPAQIDRRTVEQVDGQCRGCRLVYSFRRGGDEWWVMVYRYRPTCEPLAMPEKYRKMWGSWLVVRTEV